MPASGSGNPFIARNSSVLSSIWLSLPSLSTTGSTRRISAPITSERMVSSRAFMRSWLPRIVLISPLCRSIRWGWALLQDGNVLVEKRECTIAMLLA